MSKSADKLPNLRDELAREDYVPLMPVEKKLIGWSLGIGLVLLALLTAATRL